MLSLLIIFSSERLDRNLINAARYCGRRLLVIIVRGAVPRPLSDAQSQRICITQLDEAMKIFVSSRALIYHRRGEENSRGEMDRGN